MPEAIGAFYHPQMVTSESHMGTDNYDDTRNECSHHCPKSRRDAVAMTSRLRALERLIRRQVNRQNKSQWGIAIANDVEIERIGTPHTTVSQQAEQIRIDAGQRAMQKDNQNRRNIICRSSETQTKLHIESPINPNINSEIEVTLLPSHHGNRQSIWCRSRRRSNEFSKEGDSRVYTISFYKSKAHLEAVCRDTYRQV